MPSMPRPAKALVERLFAEQYPSLLAFLGRRARTKSDASDLAQEVYLRMLRLSDVDAIRSPEAYLYTVAGNLLKEQAVIEGRRSRSIDVEDAEHEGALQEMPVFDGDLDTRIRAERLHEVLEQLTPKCRAVVVLQYRHGLSYQQIGEHLGISPHMVKKYLSQALVHCRRRMARLA